MVKKLIDADKVINATTDILKELQEYDVLMREKTNWNKDKINLKNRKKKEILELSRNYIVIHKFLRRIL